MANFLALLKKQKKVLLVGLLFLVTIGIVLPANTYAEEVVNFGNLLHNSCTGLLIPSSDCVMGTIIGLAKGGILFAMAAPFFLIDLITTMLAHLVIIIFKFILLLALTGVSYTSLDPNTNPAVAIGWPIVRNFSNIIIVLGFIAIAMATILRIKEYEAKALLSKLIIAAVFVNFSLVICGFIINISHAIITSFLSPNGVSVMAVFSSETAVALVNRVIALLSPNTRANPISAVGLFLGGSFYNIMVIVVYLLYSLLFLFRILMLWILVILSPLAFVCSVFPATRGMVYEKWRDQFIQWCFVGAAGAFFLYLGQQMNNAMPDTFIPTTLGLNAWIADFFNSFVKFFQFFIPGFFLIMGLIISTQISAMGSGMAISLFNKGKNYATDGLKMGGKWAANKTEAVLNKGAVANGLIKPGETLRGKAANTWNKTLESTGFAGPGYAAQQEQERLAKTAKESESDDRMTKGGDALQRKIITAGPGNSAESTADFSAAVRAQQKAGKKVRKEALDSYATINNDTSVYSKDPEYAHLDKNAINAMLRQQGVEDPETATVAQRKEATQRVREVSYLKKGEEQLKAMSQEAKIQYVKEEEKEIQQAYLDAMLKGDTDAEAQKKADKKRTALAAQIYEQATEKKWLGKIGKADEIGNALAYHDNYWGTTIVGDAKKADPRLWKYDQKSIDEKVNKTLEDDGLTRKTADTVQLANATTKAEKEVKDDTYKGLTVGTIRKDLANSAIDMELIENISVKKIKNLDKQEGLSTKKIEKFQELLPEIGGTIVELRFDAEFFRGEGEDDIAQDLEEQADELQKKYTEIEVMGKK